mmetsp:Transcript_70870/g.196887  ORF Transcript_70870/g.196887 Transcript_70870/m.196887 type:complete len:147 (+) Transcript_70870:97-537(+)
MPSTVELIATGLCGIVAGALTFVSFVDTRALRKLAAEEDETTLKRFFPVWWPFGRDLMLPLLLTAAGSHVMAYLSSRRPLWLCTGAVVFSIGPYTGLVLGEDIAALRKAGTEEVTSITRRFCMLHHPRCVASMVSFAVSLGALKGE